MTDTILVIKLSALGDFIQATGAMQAIREHHAGSHITLLTTKGFKKLAQKCGYFNDIIIDERPKWYQFKKVAALRTALNEGKFDRVYDLQNNDRTNSYYKLFNAPKPEWVGTAKGASHRNTSPRRTAGHAFDGHAQTLHLAGITDIDIDDLSWMDSDISDINLPENAALIVPGCAPQHPHKRWPADRYAQLCDQLIQKDFTPVLIGAKDDKDATDAIKSACPQAIDLNGQTSLGQIAAIGRKAQLAIGNDTGPMHLIAATGTLCISVFSARTNPVRHAPKGHRVTVIQQDNLEDLSLDRVLETLDQEISTL